MNNPNIGYVAVLAPVFAFCLALLTVLGRIYFLKHFETLGIPASDVHLSAIDYSVISPDVTTMGIGICILLPVLVWGMLLFEPSPKYRQMWIGGGLSLFVVGAILGRVLTDGSSTRICSRRSRNMVGRSNCHTFDRVLSYGFRNFI